MVEGASQEAVMVLLPLVRVKFLGFPGSVKVLHAARAVAVLPSGQGAKTASTQGL